MRKFLMAVGALLLAHNALAVVLNQVQGNNWSLCRWMPAGRYVRIRSGSITGTASVSLNATQQEVLM